MEAEESANMQQTTGSQVTSTSGASATSQDQAMDIPGTSMSGQGRELDTAGETAWNVTQTLQKVNVTYIY